MKKTYCLLAFLPCFYGVFGQNLQFNVLLKGNTTLPTINDETYVRPLPVDQSSAYTSYYLTPADVSRKTLARPGVDLGVELTWKPEHKWHFNTGLHVQLIRYRIEQVYKIPDIGPFSHLVDSINGVPLGDLYSSGNIKPASSPAVVGQLSDTGINTDLIFVSIPFALEYGIGKRFQVSSGIELLTLLSARQTYKRLLWNATAVGVSEIQVSDTDKSGFSPFQANVRFAAGCRLTEKISVHLSFAAGLANLYNHASEPAFTSRLRTVALGLSYRVR